MKIKKIIVLSLVFAFLLGLCSCAGNSDKQTETTTRTEQTGGTKEQSDEQTAQTIISTGDFAPYYKNDKEKILDSIAVIAGTVTATQVIPNGVATPCTLNTVKVTKVISGTVTEDTIKVYEPGGMLTTEQALVFVGGEERAEYAKGPINALFMGYQYSHTDDKVIFFLKNSDVFEGAYETAGVVQGKMTYNGTVYVSNTPDSLTADKPEYTLQELSDYCSTVIADNKK